MNLTNVLAPLRVPRAYEDFRIDIYEERRRQSLPMNLRRKPTDAELAILRVLWSRGQSTVRDVAVDMGRESSYTTVLKLLQIMADKGLVRRDETSRTHVYAAASSPDDTTPHTSD